jgi:hypothetical protein
MPERRGRSPKDRHNHYQIKIAIKHVILGFLFSQLFAMNAAAPEGTPPRWINNREHF